MTKAVPTDLKEFNQRTFVEKSDTTDTEIFCMDCGREFIWTAGEQIFFRDKGLSNPPKRCRRCKEAKNRRLNAILRANETGIKQKIVIAVYCAKCNNETTVPFYPSQGRPVLCRVCFLKKHPPKKNGQPSKDNKRR